MFNKNSANAETFNIGPNLKSNVSVIQLIKLIKKTGNFKNLNIKVKKNLKYESKILRLSNLKAAKKINYKTKLSLRETVKLTIEWYKNYFLNKNVIFKYTQKQIADYFNK